MSAAHARPAAAAAIRYADAGMPVFHCHHITPAGACSCGRDDCTSPGKHPVPKRGVNDGIRHSSPERVRAWWGDPSHDWNVGLATGSPSGLYVVDLDGADGEAEWWALEVEHGAWPTMTARTGGGGVHRFYRLPSDVVLGNTAKRIAPHIDTRGNGGYVLLAPSNHASGHSYAWLDRRRPAMLPRWIVDRLTRHREPATGPRPVVPLTRAIADDELALRILTEEAGHVARAANGSRNDTLFKRCASVAELAWGGEMMLDTVIDHMRAAATACGLTQREADQCIRSAILTAQSSPRRIRTRTEGVHHG